MRMGKTIVDIAKIANVSKSTVSRYLNNGYVSKEAQKRIKQAIESENYEQNSFGRMLKLNRSFAIALCVPMISHPFFAKITEEIENCAYEFGYKLLVTDSDNNRAREEEFISMVYKNQVDGIIFITHNKYECFDSSLPIVTIDRLFGDNVPCITSDNYNATYNAIKYLFEKGCRNIGFIGGRPLVNSEVLERYHAYLDACKDFGLQTYVSYGNFRHGEEYTHSNEFLHKYTNLDAVFATSDTFGFTIYRVATEMNYPQQLRIITYDGCMSDWIQNPTFTTIRQDLKSMAFKVVDTLLKRINKEKVESKIIVPTEFVIGETA